MNNKQCLQLKSEEIHVYINTSTKMMPQTDNNPPIASILEQSFPVLQLNY